MYSTISKPLMPFHKTQPHPFNATKPAKPMGPGTKARRQYLLNRVWLWRLLKHLSKICSWKSPPLTTLHSVLRIKPLTVRGAGNRRRGPRHQIHTQKWLQFSFGSLFVSQLCNSAFLIIADSEINFINYFHGGPLCFAHWQISGTQTTPFDYFIWRIGKQQRTQLKFKNHHLLLWYCQSGNALDSTP